MMQWQSDNHFDPGLVPLCSATIFTLEYNFNAAQIVCTLGVSDDLR